MSIIRISLGVLLLSLISCSLFQEEEEMTINENSSTPCAGELPEVLINSWYTAGLTCDDTPECIGDNCFQFLLELREDSTYHIESTYFVVSADSTETIFYEDEGTFAFNCDTRGRFNRRFTFFYVEGQLVLNSFTRPTKSLNIRWDGFMNFQISRRSIIDDINCRMYLFER
ncbi:hypothetical protein [Neolewinella agarilytica]|uniref:Lipocalin-like domain-containing protein n=1 Tax=Neolewinella agarilytica TaxID=478744 RepID=A0A1H8ZEX3_9BACT|nr:hypothetical protein [Neolewinella agarilytica]SEP63019.1 hypothetical protein SAMN05444359_101300 [Neolewinella agarilytica]